MYGVAGSVGAGEGGSIGAPGVSSCLHPAKKPKQMHLSTPLPLNGTAGVFIMNCK